MTRPSLNLLALSLLFLVGSQRAVQTQIFLPTPEQGGAEFGELQRSFHDWSRGKDLNRTRGWKWYKRWEYFNDIRTGADGSLPDPALYEREARKVIERKDGSDRSLAGAGWIPLGPLELTEHPQSRIHPGVGRINCVTFHPADENTMWVGVAQGGIWKTVDGGSSWFPLSDGLPILRISDIAVDPKNHDILYASLGDYAYLGTALRTDNRKRNSHYGLGIYKSIDGGKQWSPTGLSFSQTQYDGSLICRTYIDPQNTSNLVAAGTGGVWRSTDAGTSWNLTINRFVWDIEQDPNHPHTLYASTGYSAQLGLGEASIMKSVDFGTTWRVLPTDLPTTGVVERVELAVSIIDPEYVYAVACGIDHGFHGLYRSTDAGESWSTRSDLASGPNILGWQNGDSADQGGQGTYDLTILVHPFDRETVYVGGVNLWGSNDGGVSWDGISYTTNDLGPSVHADQHLLSYNGMNDRYYLCNDGGIYSTDSIAIGSWQRAFDEWETYQWPTVWINHSNNLNITSFYRLGLSRSTPGVVIAGSQDNHSFYRGNPGWINIFGGDGMECLIDPNDPQLIYGSSQYGYINMSRDGGKTADGWINRAVFENGETGEWTTPMMLHPDDPSTLYAAFGNLWRTSGDPSIWTPLSSFEIVPGLGYPAASSALAICTTQPNTIYLAKRPYFYLDMRSQLLASSDGGTSWRDITAGLPDSLYFTYLAVHDQDPQTAWISCGGFVDEAKVFKTTDGGASWRNISAGLPNLPANCIVHQAGSLGDIVYIGMDLGVYYTRNGMNGWGLLNENLPNVIVSELEIDYQTMSLVAATFGRGIWQASINEISSAPDDRSPRNPLQATLTRDGSSGRIRFDVRGLIRGSEIDLQLIDVMGRVVFQKRYQDVDERMHDELSITLPYGVYFLRASDGKRVAVGRM